MLMCIKWNALHTENGPGHIRASPPCECSKECWNKHGNITFPSVTTLIQFNFMLKMKQSQDYLNQGQYSFRWDVWWEEGRAGGAWLILLPSSYLYFITKVMEASTPYCKTGSNQLTSIQIQTQRQNVKCLML